MDNFLSLPRFAKGGLAVLLAVALLGWAIVAYSAKQQHEISQGRDTAIATLKNQGDREAEALAEIKLLEERLQAAETELAALPEAVEDSPTSQTEEATPDLQTLRGQLTDTTNVLNARSAALQERERDLEKAQADVAALTTEVEGLAAVSEQRDVLRGRLTDTMTKLSAANATLQQRDRELAKALTEAEAAASEIKQLEAVLAERDDLKERLNKATAELSAQSETVEQKEQALARVQADYDQALASVETLTSSSEEQAAAGRSVDALAAELGETKKALDDSVAALEKNQAALTEQEAGLATLEKERNALADEISEMNAEVEQKEQKITDLTNSIAEAGKEAEAARNEVSKLSLLRDDGAAESSSLAAEIDSLQSVLSEKEDAIVDAETELARIKGEIDGVDQQLDEKRSLLTAQGEEIRGVEADLAALKADQAVVEAKRGELDEVTSQQEQALQNLADIRQELSEQEALLETRRSQILEEEARLAALQKGQVSTNRSLPTIPIAELGDGRTAILPIDPMQTPIPVQTKNGLRLTVVHFDLGSAQLTPGAMKRAKDAASWIKAQAKGEKIRLIGATDTIGTRENNMILATRRAQSLLDVFKKEGIDPERIELISMGEAGGSAVIGDQTSEPLNRCVGVFIGES